MLGLSVAASGHKVFQSVRFIQPNSGRATIKHYKVNMRIAHCRHKNRMEQQKNMKKMFLCSVESWSPIHNGTENGLTNIQVTN